MVIYSAIHVPLRHSEFTLTDNSTLAFSARKMAHVHLILTELILRSTRGFFGGLARGDRRWAGHEVASFVKYTIF